LAILKILLGNSTGITSKFSKFERTSNFSSYDEMP